MGNGFFLEGSDNALLDGDAAMPADSTEPGPNVVVVAAIELLLAEFTTLVANGVLRRASGAHEGHGKRDSLRGMRDGVQDGAFGNAVGHVVRFETETGEAHEEEGQADDGREEPDPALEREDLGLKFELVQGQDMGRDDRALAAANPACDGGARDTEVMEEHGVTSFADDVPKSVVTRLTAGQGWHASRSIAMGSSGKTAEGQLLQQFRGWAQTCRGAGIAHSQGSRGPNLPGSYSEF